MATTATKIDQSLSGLDQEIVPILWVTTDATAEITTGLSVIYAWSFARAGTADVSDMGLLSIDETVETDGSITVVSGAITVDRVPALAAGTLIAENHNLILYGKS